MIETKGQIKKWGNSIGIRIKKDILENSGIGLNSNVKVILIPEKAIKVKDIFGILKIKKPTQEIMREIDEELDIGF
ncbi:hypothetical protein HYX18_03585 [Candidatus Woesearchaeota archaeon]|nr:hypothetical protein [Candidatus Woesearchaeota archaeon]